MKEKIAKELQESGLFGWAVKPDSPRFHDPDKFGDEIPLMPWPDADTSEAILAEMELQVVFSDADCEWNLIGEINIAGRPIKIGEFYINNAIIIYYWRGEKGQRTLANNSALAWLSKQPEWQEKLKLAISKIRGVNG